MINLPVSEAEAWDYYAILEVKYKRGLDVLNRYDEVSRVLGGNYYDVMASQEYAALVEANAVVFDAIECAHHDRISASEVQRLNHVRYLAKQALQARFWPNEPLSEKKQNLKRLPLAAAAPTVPPSSQRGDPAL